AVGMMSVLARDEHGVTAIATTDTAVLTIPREVVLGALELRFSLLRNSLRLCAGAVVRSRDELPAQPGSDSDVSPGVYREHGHTMVERLLVVRDSPLFSRCSIDAAAELVRHSQEMRGQAGDLLWDVGDPSTFGIRIEYGVFRCANRDGRSVRIGSDYVLGMTDSLAGTPRSFSARAETHYICYRNELEPFLAVLEAHFDMAMDLLAVYANLLLQSS
ncbi:MAG: hypothetical protein AAGC55_22720, partial [Myxococcota bacterium]